MMLKQGYLTKNLMLTTWPVSGFLSPKHGQNYSWEETTPPHHTNPNIFNNHVAVPHQKELKKKTPVTFPVNKTNPQHSLQSSSPSVANLPTPPRLGLQGGQVQVQHGLDRRHGAENMATADMQSMEVSCLPGKKLKKRRVVSCSKFWMQVEVSWLLQRRNPSWWHKRVTWVSVAVFVFTCRVVVENVPCSWNIDCRASHIHAYICNLGNFPKTHPTCTK